MKIICLDYDKTYTDFKELCDLIIDKQTEFSYKVILCTMRYPEEASDDLDYLATRINVYYSSRQAKREYLASLDIYRNRQENAVIFSHCDELAKFYTN